jgi:hypothetical protein
MLLLINRRYPAFGFVLGLIAALISIVIGVAIGQATFIVMGVGSLALSFARLRVLRRSHAPVADR